jgi:hypothetical protein
MFEGSFSSSREGSVRDFCSIAALFVARFEAATGAPAHACSLNYPFGFERFELDEFMTRVGRQNALQCLLDMLADFKKNWLS